MLKTAFQGVEEVHGKQKGAIKTAFDQHEDFLTFSGKEAYSPFVTTEAAPKKTPLYNEHVKLGAKIIDFGGWLMPVQYSGIIDEHQAVRNGVGVFDISHMGEIFVYGAGAKAWLNHVLTNQIEHIAPGKCQYTFLLNENGGVIDDLIVYQLDTEEYLLVVNASKIDEDFAWLTKQAEGVADLTLVNRSDDYAGLAIQGPSSTAFFKKFFGASAVLPERNGVGTVSKGNVQAYVARTGYTGEDGFELFLPAGEAASFWQQILAEGAEFGLKPAGLGARDTLRLEMCYPLNGNDLSPEKTPLEAGLGFFVELEKPFIGRDTLLQQKRDGVPTRLVAFKILDKAPPPRAHYPVVKDGVVIGETCSGSLSPSLGCGIGLAYLPADVAKVGTPIEIDIRGRRFAAVIEKKPLYRKA